MPASKRREPGQAQIDRPPAAPTAVEETRPIAPNEATHFPAQNGGIRTATIKDLKFVDALALKFAKCVGFLPRPALTWYTEHAHVRIVEQNTTPAGYLLGLRAYRWQPLLRPITQACVAMDAQRRHLGLSLIESLSNDALTTGQVGIQCMCRDGLEANEFWPAAGFERIGDYDPNSARGRKIICWRKRLIESPPDWFFKMPPVAGWKARRLGSTLTGVQARELDAWLRFRFPHLKAPDRRKLASK